MSAFSARYAGKCGNCGEGFQAGDLVQYADADGELCGVDCCGQGGSASSASLLFDEQREANREDPALAAVMVLPRGRTARDKCGKCFQVPASNGVCGCDG